ncbi:MAG TPA: DUF86 domain-containing protein [Desulfonatronum sp.]|nr:DUF86 domain-containing protein [Desulfonatronum sp.]
MSSVPASISAYLAEIRKNSQTLNALVADNELHPGSTSLNVAKYILIELAEATARTVQSILARDMGLAVSDYSQVMLQGHAHGLLAEDLYTRLKPCASFHNSLILRYWTQDDQTMIQSILNGQRDFEEFITRIEGYVKSENGGTGCPNA